MQKLSSSKEVQELTQYYKEKDLLIVGLNDSQGVSGLVKFLANYLTSEDLTPEVITAFSLTMNKTEHIDYFLQNNLSMEEIKLSQIYSTVSALEKVMQDIGAPKFLGKIGYLHSLVCKVEKREKDIRISTALKEAEEPILIYSSGVNNLMREVGSNPTAIKKDYKKRLKRPNYDYTLEKTKDPNTLKRVIDSIERNYETILGINDYADIYALGGYIPKSLRKKEMDIFRELVFAYNEGLENLCKQYDVTYIATSEVGKKYNSNEVDFHIATKGYEIIAKDILQHLYQNKILNVTRKSHPIEEEIQITNRGAIGVIEKTKQDYRETVLRSLSLTGYPLERELQIAEEHERETKIFKKVLEKTKKC